MSQFNYFSDMNSLVNLDGELRMQSKPRWQRKVENSMNGSVNASKLSVSYNNSYIAAIGGNTTTTGNKTPNKSMAEAGGAKRKTPNDKKSPGKNGIHIFCFATQLIALFTLITGRKTPTHNGNGSKTPSGGGGGDRFIPNRAATNFDLSHFLVSSRSHFTSSDAHAIPILDQTRTVQERVERELQR